MCIVRNEYLRFFIGEKSSPSVLSAFPPPGCLATAGALMYGLRAFNQGKNRQSQVMMRGRIFAQGFTVVAIIFGVLTTAIKSKP